MLTITNNQTGELVINKLVINNKLFYKRKTPTFLSWCFVFLPFIFMGQINLVPNPSFEIYSSCPNAQGQIKSATGWDTLSAGGGGRQTILMLANQLIVLACLIIYCHFSIQKVV